MRINETTIQGVVVVELNPESDDRGFFARSHSREEFARAGLMSVSEESSVSYNFKRATLRGLHYQAEPFPDAKLVRCTRGAIFDVAVDLRPASPTFLDWYGIELTADNRRGMHVPKGCAHGFITLEDDTEITYMIGARYQAELARGVRWDDPCLGIQWPIAPEIMSERDRTFPDFDPAVPR